jgi:hypothetical protein
MWAAQRQLGCTSSAAALLLDGYDVSKKAPSFFFKECAPSACSRSLPDVLQWPLQRRVERLNLIFECSKGHTRICATWRGEEAAG